MTSGDGWTICASGHRHWGLFGAAGLLLADGERVVLQHRAPWTHEGGTWGVPGGARNGDEDALAAALRESREEAGLDGADVEPIGILVDDHAGWSYTTVVARPRRQLSPMAANAESVAVQWHAVSDVDSLPLHNGFALAWRRLRDVPAPLYLVLGPDVASDPLVALLASDGVAADRLPSGLTAGGLDRLLPHIIAADPAADSRPPAHGQVLAVATAAELRSLV